MDGNFLMEIMKNGLLGIASSSISSFIGTMVSSLFLRKNTLTSEFEKIKIGKFNDLIDQLLENGEITYLEFYKSKNLLEIAEKADRTYNKEKSGNFHQDNFKFDFDWFLRFFDYASNISNEEMQEVWAKVLSREIQYPNSTSITLLNALSMMRQEQALLFCNISKFALMDINEKFAHPLIFISSNREVYETQNITPLILKNFDRLGLLECNFLDEYIFMNKKVFQTQDKIITVFGTSRSEQKIKSGNVTFTRDGQLLYSMLDDDSKKCDEETLSFIIKRFENRKCKIVIDKKSKGDV